MPSTAHRAHECAICRRSFLAGETVRLYRDHPSRAAVRVCELCPTTAEARGWMPAESTGRRLRMPADPGRLELAERRDALVERLTGQLATLEEELEQARGVREEADAAQAALSAAHGEIDRLTARLASTRNELEAACSLRATRKPRSAGSSRRRSAAAQDGAPVAPDAGELDRVLRAREREADASELIGIAARAFNRSPHLRAGARARDPARASQGHARRATASSCRAACSSRSCSAASRARSSSRSTSSRARRASPARPSDEQPPADGSPGALEPRRAASSCRE